jgi:hypothetical protein
MSLQALADPAGGPRPRRALTSGALRNLARDLQAPAIRAGVAQRVDESTNPAAVDELKLREVDWHALAFVF